MQFIFFPGIFLNLCDPRGISTLKESCFTREQHIWHTPKLDEQKAINLVTLWKTKKYSLPEGAQLKELKFFELSVIF